MRPAKHTVRLHVQSKTHSKRSSTSRSGARYVDASPSRCAARAATLAVDAGLSLPKKVEARNTTSIYMRMCVWNNALAPWTITRTLTRLLIHAVYFCTAKQLWLRYRVGRRAPPLARANIKDAGLGSCRAWISAGIHNAAPLLGSMWRGRCHSRLGLCLPCFSF